MKSAFYKVVDNYLLPDLNDIVIDYLTCREQFAMNKIYKYIIPYIIYERCKKLNEIYCSDMNNINVHNYTECSEFMCNLHNIIFNNRVELFKK